MSLLPQSYVAPIDFRIPQAAPDGLEPQTRRAFEEVYGGLNQIVRALVTYCGIGPAVPANWAAYNNSSSTLLSGNLRRFYSTAAEAITYGQLVSFYNDAGSLKIRLANATDNTRAAVGYCNVLTGVAAGEVGEFILGTGVPLFAGLTIGAHYWLATVNGTISPTPALAAGNIEQYVGVAISASELNCTIAGFIQH